MVSVPVSSQSCLFVSINQLIIRVYCVMLSHVVTSIPNLKMGSDMGTKKLNAKQAQNLKDAGRHSDGDGLYLYISKTGSKSWVYRYSINKRTRDMGLGAYPDLSLSEARQEHEKWSKLAKRKIDPINEREALQRAYEDKRSFEDLAMEFIEDRKETWTNPKSAQAWENTLRMYAFPIIGHQPIEKINAMMIKDILKPIWRTKSETASRLRGRIENIINYGIALGESDKANPAALGIVETLLKKNPAKSKVKHFESMHYTEIPFFWSDISKVDFVSASALKFLILTCARVGEVVKAEWSEIDNEIWIIPANRTKTKREHRVPLSPGAIDILNSLPQLNDFVFPSSRLSGSICTNSVLKFLQKNMDRPDLTVHGFRSTFRVWAEECTNCDSRIAEACLAHVLSNKTEAAYMRSDLLDKRRLIMNDWSDYVTGGR